MKKIVQQPSVAAIDLVLFIARVGISILMLTHGLVKLSGLMAEGPVQFPSVLGMSPEVSLSLAVFAEVGCSLALLLGFVTRLAVIPLMITMLVAVFNIHAADAFDKKELAVQYLLVYVILLIAGGGRYSVDFYLQQRMPAIKVSRRVTEDHEVAMYQ